MKVLAIDPGLASTGWALVDGMKYLASGTITTKPGPSVAFRSCDIVDDLRDATYQYRQGEEIKLVVEYPEVAYLGKAYKGVMENFYVSGFIAGRLSSGYGIGWVATVTPPTWSKGYKGRMGERMEAARNMAVKAFKVTERTSVHSRDALGIALWAVTGGIK